MPSVNDLIEDFEGDKAVVREVTEDGRIGIEWDCRPGVIVWPDPTFLAQGYTNLTERVLELRSERLVALTDDEIKALVPAFDQAVAIVMRMKPELQAKYMQEPWWSAVKKLEASRDA